jgi:tetratricopeptide (TPR) repeat protein
MRVITGDSSVAVARVLGHLVGPQLLSGNLEDALHTAEQAYAIAEATRDTVEMVAQLYALGYVTRRAGATLRALTAFTRTLELIRVSHSTEPDLEMLRIMALAERSACLLSLGQQPAAETEAASAFWLARRATRFNVVGQAAIALADALAARGAHDEAIILLAPAYENLWDPPVRTNLSLLAERIADRLSTSYAAVGNRGMARRYSELAAIHRSRNTASDSQWLHRLRKQ